MGFPSGGFTSRINYYAEPSDIFIVTHPQCGTL